MQEIYKTNPNGKKQVKTTTFFVALLVTAILIFSSVPIIATLGNTTKMNENMEFKADLAGLDPNFVAKNAIKANSLANPITQPIPLPFADVMHGYILYGGGSGEPVGPCYLPLDDPGDVTSLQVTGSDDFIAGGTWTCDERWLGCEYGTGALWEIDPENGDMTSIGGGGTSCNGLAWDPVYNRLYGTTGTMLVEYDPNTGEQEFIGSHGQSGKTMIALAINLEGVCYAWDVLWDGESTLFTVDLETGAATEVGSMGETLVYAQDGHFDYRSNVLYLTAYYPQGFLATVDTETGELTRIGNFEGGAQITGSMIMASCIPPKPDLDCEGTLSWTDVKPGKTAGGNFNVSNIGEPFSLLDWEIESYPEWGVWSFDPQNGTDLTPEDDPVTVTVTVTAPDEKNSEFVGDVKIVNIENSSDFCIIDVSLTTPKNKAFNFYMNILMWLFERFPNAFPILRYMLEL